MSRSFLQLSAGPVPPFLPRGHSDKSPSDRSAKNPRQTLTGIFFAAHPSTRCSGTYIADRTGIPEDPLGFKFVDDNVKLSFDLIESRLVLEPDIAALAAARRTEEDCAALREINEQTSALRNSGGDYRDSDLKFHCKIAECSKNGVFKILIPILTQSIIRATTVQVEAYEVLSPEQKAKITNAAHTNIVDAICRSDVEGARYAMIHHLTHGREYYRKQLEAHLEKKGK